MKPLATTFLSILIGSSLFAQKTEIAFEVSFKGKKIGVVKAIEEKTGAKSIKDLKTETDTKILMMSLHVESEVKVVKENGVLLEGTAYRHANRGSEDVHAHVKKIASKTYQRERNGQTSKIEKEDITMCMVDLYFKEPKGVTSVFSNMYAEKLELKPMGGGKYQLITPDKKNSYYSYQNGKLVTVEADTPVGKVLSTRI
jgi:hypothetical protein